MRTAEAAPKIWVCFADFTHNSQKKCEILERLYRYRCLYRFLNIVLFVLSFYVLLCLFIMLQVQH